MSAAKKAPAKDTRVHFVTGSDEAGVKKAATELASRLAPSDDPFAVETIDAACSTVDEVAQRIDSAIEALLTIPFFGGGKLVWLKSATFLSDTVLGRSDTVTAAIEKLLAVIERGLPDGITLLISATEPDKRRAAYKILTKHAATTLHDKPDFGWGATEADVVEWVQKQVGAKKLRITPEGVQILAARVGAETRQLDNELEKLSLAFPGDAPITERDVRLLVPATRAGGIFDLANAIARRDIPLCAASLNQLFRQGEKAIGILLAAIVPTLRNLVVVKDLMARHKIQPPSQAQFFASSLKRLPESALAHLPRKKDGTLSTYALGIAAIHAGRYTLPEIERAFIACARANRELVTTQLAEDVVLHRLLAEIAGRG